MLPFDLLQVVLEAVDDKKSLAHCCQTSKVMLEIARPLLYRNIEILINETEAETPADTVVTFHAITRQSCFLLRSLELFPRLRRCAQDLTFCVSSQITDPQAIAITDPLQPPSLAISMIPKPRQIFLDVHPTIIICLDPVLSRFQMSNLSPPILHLRCPEHLWFYLRQAELKASFQSLDVEDGIITYAENLYPTFHETQCLTVQCSDESQLFSLTQFTNLERLVLHLPALLNIINVEEPYKDIMKTLRKLQNLHIIVISGSPSPTLDKLVSPGNLLDTIPPCVVTFVLEMTVGLEKVVEIVKNLPPSTGIKTLGIRFDGGDLTELVAECDKKKIKLALA